MITCRETSLCNMRSMGSCTLESVPLALFSASCWTEAALRIARLAQMRMPYRSVAAPRAGCSVPSWFVFGFSGAVPVEDLVAQRGANEATLARAWHDEVARMQYRCTGNEF